MRFPPVPVTASLRKKIRILYNGLFVAENCSDYRYAEAESAFFVRVLPMHTAAVYGIPPIFPYGCMCVFRNDIENNVTTIAPASETS